MDELYQQGYKVIKQWPEPTIFQKQDGNKIRTISTFVIMQNTSSFGAWIQNMILLIETLRENLTGEEVYYAITQKNKTLYLTAQQLLTTTITQSQSDFTIPSLKNFTSDDVKILQDELDLRIVSNRVNTIKQWYNDSGSRLNKNKEPYLTFYGAYDRESLTAFRARANGLNGKPAWNIAHHMADEGDERYETESTVKRIERWTDEHKNIMTGTFPITGNSERNKDGRIHERE